MRKEYPILAIIALAIIVLDQITKIWVVRAIRLYDSIPVIEGIFDLVHIRNRGMAFGLMNRSDIDVSFYFLVLATMGAIIFILFWFIRLKTGDRRLTVGFSLVLGGAIGNLIDRIRLKEVIDFLDFYLGKYHWPAFNVADSAITLGAFWLALNMLLFHRPKEN